MPRQRANVAVRKKKVSVTLPDEQIDWLEQKVSERVFANMSHGVELCIREGQKTFGKPKAK